MTLGNYKTPGVYKEDIFLKPRPAFLTGVPVFLGLTALEPADPLQKLTLWSQFVDRFGAATGYLGVAVHGFFLNGGELCYVLRLANGSPEALQRGLDRVAALTAIDLVCAPDIMWAGQASARPDPQVVQTGQQKLLDHCALQGDRFAILDALPGSNVDAVLAQRRGLGGANGALYYPWLQLANMDQVGLVPPCGHVAGVYTRSDREVGVHKAPANAVLEGVVNLELGLSNVDQERLNPEGVNAIRGFPGRGIRVWGARTLSNETAWTYVNVRRIFLTAARWIEANMTDTVFEPNNPQLWARIGRELGAYFQTLFEQGALRGATPQEAFYVKCNAETNPPEVRDQGRVVSEIGLAPGLPNEFIVVRIIHGASGVTIAGPSLLG